MRYRDRERRRSRNVEEAEQAQTLSSLFGAEPQQETMIKGLPLSAYPGYWDTTADVRASARQWPQPQAQPQEQVSIEGGAFLLLAPLLLPLAPLLAPLGLEFGEASS